MAREDIPCRYLLQRGARLSIKDRNGRTALNHARIMQENEMIPLLEAALKQEQAGQRAA